MRWAARFCCQVCGRSSQQEQWSCGQAGQGAQIQLRFGGKTEALGGEPIDALVSVVALSANLAQAFGGVEDNESGNLGQAALIRLPSADGRGAEVILCSTRVQIFSPTAWSNLGRDPAQYAVIAIKSAKCGQTTFASHFVNTLLARLTKEPLRAVQPLS